MRMKIVIAGLCGAMLPLAGMSVATAEARAAGPTFQLPFPCGERWAASSRSGAHTGYEIDFNGSATDGDRDLGRTVVAAAAGTVTMSEYRTTDGFGNLVKIRHSDGSMTLYAHLNSRTVSVGSRVNQGQKIGTLGKSSAKYKGMAAHLHYEQRNSANQVVRASFNGVPFRYPSQTLTSKNCGGGTSNTSSNNTSSNSNAGGNTGANPYTPEQICGAGFSRVDSAALGNQGRVYLLYKASTGENCVTALRNSVSGKVSARAYLEVQGKARITDAGSFQYYAGPVRARAARTCVKWGGAIGSASYDSNKFEHCG